MTDPLPVVSEHVRGEALHGSWCPKLCNHACPVLAATGRNDAMPWSFHRTVTDLGTLPPDRAGTHLEACTGCLACQVPCVFDQDVPAQVRAGRSALATAGAPLGAAVAARDTVAGGRTPYGAPAVEAPADDADADVTVVAGCRDDRDTLEALARIHRAAGVTVRFVVPDGCCGGVLDDLGATEAADERGRLLADRLGAGPVVATDPHCLDRLRSAAGDRVTDAASAVVALVHAGRLALAAGEPDEVTYHDPCLLARASEPVLDAPRSLLASAGLRVVEAEGHGARTVCSGAGLGYELVAPHEADAVARRRVGQLAGAAPRAVTACAGARARLAANGADVTGLFQLLSRHLQGTTT